MRFLCSKEQKFSHISRPSLHPSFAKSAFALFATLLGISLSFHSCFYDVEELLYPKTSGCDSLNVSYKQTVLPILESNCILCHNKNDRLGGLNLESFDTLKLEINNGRFLRSILHEAGASPMPKDRNQLNSCDLAILENWIEEGAKNN